MRKSLQLLIACFAFAGLSAQESMEQIIEKRSREFHRVISLSDKESYKKFMKENYTKEFLEKPIKLNRVVKDSDGNSSTAKEKPMDNLDAKVALYEQLHNDFGGAPLASVAQKDNKIELIVKSMGLKGKFTLMFSKEKPYLIEGMGIEADMEN